MVSDTLISSLDTVGFSVPRVALVLWVAKILVEVLVAYDLADIVKGLMRNAEH